jgi:16S rRNA (guanine527-N7)-methyltransferase
VTRAGAEMTPSSGLSLSTETESRLQQLAELVVKWNRTVNLVAASTVPVLRERHLVDSAQLVMHMPPNTRHWADLGTGGGFPGLVVAAILAERDPPVSVTLVEADQRKAAFLREAARALGLTVRVLAERIESCPPLSADVVSARALAPLPVLLSYAHRHLSVGGTGLFLKGSGVMAELDHARAYWTFGAELLQSQTSPDGCVLKIQGLRHAG